MAFKSRVKVRDSDPGFKKLIKRLTGPDRVDIGVFADQGSDLVIKAASNEFGTSTIKIKRYTQTVWRYNRR